MATSDRTMTDLYRSLAPTERVRLVARLVSAGNLGELRRVRDALPPTPDTHRAAYSRALQIAAHMPLPLHACCEGLHGALEAIRATLSALLHEQRRHHLLALRLSDLWCLLPYPLTRSEYQDLIAQERDELQPTGELAQFIAQGFCADDAPRVCPTIAAWLTADDAPGPTSTPGVEVASSEAPPWDWRPAAAEVRALLEGAIARGELPPVTTTPAGPALAWGPFTDWLHATPPSAYTPYGPDYHLAAVQVLRGLLCVWDVRPDDEADAVRTRRHALIATLADLADLTPDRTPPADPPTSREEWQRQQDALEAAWPWRPTPRELALLQQVAADHASISREVTALGMAVDTVQATEFGGADPLPPRIRATCEALRADVTHLTAGWRLGADQSAYGDDWPPLPDPDPERLTERCAAFVQMLADV